MNERELAEHFQPQLVVRLFFNSYFDFIIYFKIINPFDFRRRIGDCEMDFISRERFGIFLIVVSFWYLINIKIFNVLHPVLAIPGSAIFMAGLWLLLSLPTPTTKTSAYIPIETPVQAATEATPTPVSKPTQKLTKKSKLKPIKKT